MRANITTFCPSSPEAKFESPLLFLISWESGYCCHTALATEQSLPYEGSPTSHISRKTMPPAVHSALLAVSRVHARPCFGGALSEYSKQSYIDYISSNFLLLFLLLFSVITRGIMIQLFLPIPRATTPTLKGVEVSTATMAAHLHRCHQRRPWRRRD